MPLPAPLVAIASLLLSAAPRLTASIAPAAARPGDAVLVRVAGATSAPRGELAGRPLAFFRAGREWRAFAPLPTETAVGELRAELEADGARTEAALAIVEPGWPSREISGVPARFVEPPPDVTSRIAADRAAFNAAYARPAEPPRFRRAFAWPRQARLSGRFGDQRVFDGVKQSVHYGADVTGPVGAPIRAANDGVVVLVREAYLSGRTVVLSHGAGVFTAYFHLSRIDVRPGQAVRRGARIGRLGATGRASGPHLHWSVRVGGLFVDPESLLGIDPASGKAPPRAPRLPSAAPGAPAVTAGAAGGAPGTPALEGPPAAGDAATPLSAPPSR
ncbi:M23 family metallopeptidase [Anaeromyxobacter terrae]|uniref:M23 family metallopeptidase n=1 Tax=Anaeromyxobacter terrae TaxID=2925406 RepID=UPI001F561BC2|nr:M23 family metallopeptidase [Anaeromyxobacter sp. SG22]